MRLRMLTLLPLASAHWDPSIRRDGEGIEEWRHPHRKRCDSASASLDPPPLRCPTSLLPSLLPSLLAHPEVGPVR